MSRRPHHARAAHLQPVTEAEVERAVVGLFALNGWYTLRTEANMTRRGGKDGSKQKAGHIPAGFPDYVMMLGLGNGLGLCALVELKRPKGGRLSGKQKLMKANLEQNYRQQVHVVRSLEEALEVIERGHRLQARLIEVGLT